MTLPFQRRAFPCRGAVTFPNVRRLRMCVRPCVCVIASNGRDQGVSCCVRIVKDLQFDRRLRLPPASGASGSQLCVLACSCAAWKNAV